MRLESFYEECYEVNYMFLGAKKRINDIEKKSLQSRLGCRGGSTQGEKIPQKYRELCVRVPNLEDKEESSGLVHDEAEEVLRGYETLDQDTEVETS